MIMKQYTRVYAPIDLDAIRFNMESMKRNLAPGTGIGTTVPFVKMIKEKGIKPNAIGVEVISDANLEKGIEYAAKHTYENTKKVLEEAWPEVL